MKNFLEVLIPLSLVLSTGSLGISKELSINELSKLIFDPANQIKSVEDVLPRLPLKLRQNYVLMTESKSLQAATPDNPRVIMFGKNADFFLTFNGGPGRNSYGTHSLEAIEYNAQTKRYEFAEFIFSEASKNNQGFEPHRKNQFVSENRNPSKCMGCHGPVDPRPNWEPYPRWPGAVPQSFLVSPKEMKYLKDFVVRGADHPRYKFLERQQNIDNMVKIKLETSMASQMDDALSPYRKDRLITKLHETDNYQAYRYALTGALAACPDIDTFVPEAIKAKFDRVATRRQLAASIQDRMKKDAPLHSLFYFTPENATVVADLRWLLESRRIEIDFWSMSLQSFSLFTTTADAFYPDVVSTLAREEGVNPPYRALMQAVTTPVAKRMTTSEDRATFAQFCQTLKAKSLAQGPRM